MADQKKDDMAAALAALAGGAVPSEHESPSGGIPSETTVFAPPPPVEPIEKPPATAAEFRPPRATAPPSQQKKPKTPTAMPTPPGGSPTPPLARIRPAAPTASPGSSPTDSARSAPRQRPAMPERAAAPVAPLEPVAVRASPTDDDDDVLSHIVEDDRMEAPAADISTFARTPVIRKKAKGSIYANLKFRKTVIPFLLTNGVLLPAVGVWTLQPGSPLHDQGPLLPIILFAVGLVLLATGVLNALHVKQIMKNSNT